MPALFPSHPRAAAWGALALAVGLILATPPPAAAQSNAEARVFFDRGNQALQRADRARGRRQRQFLEEALSHYVQSLGIVRSKNAVYNAGVVLERLGRPTEAFGYFREYLDRYELSEASRTAGQARIDAITPEVAIVRVQSDPPGASVYVDRLDLAPRGETPIDIAVAPGNHTLVLRLAEHQEARTEAIAVRGDTASVSLTLAPEPIDLVVHGEDEGGTLEVDGESRELGTLSLSPGEHRIRWLVPGRPALEELVVLVPGQVPEPLLLRAPEVERALLEIRADTASRVVIDGNEVAVGAHLELQLDPGPHDLELIAPDREPLRLRIVLSAGERRMVELTLPEEGGGGRYGAAPAVLTAIAAAAGAVGGGFAIAGGILRGDYDENAAEAVDRHDEIERNFLIADIVGLGVGGALGVVSIVLWATRNQSSEEDDASSATVDVLAGPSGAFATLRVPFGEGAR